MSKTPTYKGKGGKGESFVDITFFSEDLADLAKHWVTHKKKDNFSDHRTISMDIEAVKAGKRYSRNYGKIQWQDHMGLFKRPPSVASCNE